MQGTRMNIFAPSYKYVPVGHRDAHDESFGEQGRELEPDAGKANMGPHGKCKSHTRRAFDVLTLLVSGAVIGLYLMKGTGILGVDVTGTLEQVGMGTGAAIVAVLKAIHLV